MAQIASFKKGKFKIYVEFLYERAPNSPRLCKKQKRGNVFKIPPQINDANCPETLSTTAHTKEIRFLQLNHQKNDQKFKISLAKTTSNPKTISILNTEELFNFTIFENLD